MRELACRMHWLRLRHSHCRYPGEEEYLWPPCSFLQSEDSGGEVEVQAGGGIVSMCAACCHHVFEFTCAHVRCV